jgi:hypothetical protein
MDLWEQDDIDLVAPGFIEFGENHQGSPDSSPCRGGSTGGRLPIMGRPAWSSPGKVSTRAIPSRVAAGRFFMRAAHCAAISTSIWATIPAIVPCEWRHRTLEARPVVSEVPDSAVDLLAESANWSPKSRLRQLLGLDGRPSVAPAWEPTLFTKRAVDERAVNRKSTPEEKLALYRALFRGRDDVYALRWENARTGRSGWSPAVR